MSPTVSQFVLLVAVVTFFNNGRSWALSIKTVPEPFNEKLDKELNITCVPDGPTYWAKRVHTMQLVKDDKTIAVLRHDGINMGPGSSSKMEAEGKIEREARHSFLTVVINNPDKDDVGTYTCRMYYEDLDFLLKEEKSSTNVTVYKKDLSSIVTHLLEKVVQLEKTSQEQEKQLNKQTTVISSLNKALKKMEDVSAVQDKVLKQQNDVISSQDKVFRRQIIHINSELDKALKQQNDVISRQDKALKGHIIDINLQLDRSLKEQNDVISRQDKAMKRQIIIINSELDKALKQQDAISDSLTRVRLDTTYKLKTGEMTKLDKVNWVTYNTGYFDKTSACIVPLIAGKYYVNVAFNQKGVGKIEMYMKSDTNVWNLGMAVDQTDVHSIMNAISLKKGEKLWLEAKRIKGTAEVFWCNLTFWLISPDE